jgi:hypothetical protein
MGLSLGEEVQDYGPDAARDVTPKPRRGGVAYGAAALPPVTDDAPEVDEVLDAEPATDETPADPQMPDFDPDQDRRQAGLIG